MPLRGTSRPTIGGRLLEPHYAATTGCWVVAEAKRRGAYVRYVAEFDGPDARREASQYVTDRAHAVWRPSSNRKH